MSHEYDDGTLAADYARASVLASRAGQGDPQPDGTERLCLAVYGRAAGPRDYLGGSEARMLHDGADTIARLTRERDEARAEVERMRAREPILDMERDAFAELQEARAEAERLRQQLADAREVGLGAHSTATARADAAEAEVERLRAGLRGLIAKWETRDPAPSDFFAGCDIARNACAEDALGETLPEVDDALDALRVRLREHLGGDDG